MLLARSGHALEFTRERYKPSVHRQRREASVSGVEMKVYDWSRCPFRHAKSVQRCRAGSQALIRVKIVLLIVLKHLDEFGDVLHIRIDVLITDGLSHLLLS